MNQKSWKKLFPFSKSSIEVTSKLIEGLNVNIRPKILSDGESDYLWRIDPELSDLDATNPITLSLDEYLKFHESELKYPSKWSVRFAIETKEKKHIGNCMYYDIDYSKKTTELGIMIGNKKYWNKGHGTEAWIEGPTLKRGSKVTILEDVITTGGSSIEAVKRIRDVGYKVNRVVSIIDRQENGEADAAMKWADLELISLYKLKELI